MEAGSTKNEAWTVTSQDLSGCPADHPPPPLHLALAEAQPRVQNQAPGLDTRHLCRLTLLLQEGSHICKSRESGKRGTLSGQH